MPDTHISESQNTSYVASTNNETIILDPLATITAGTNACGFYFGLYTTGITFIVNGTVKGSGTIQAGIINNATGNTVEISETGKVEGDFGVENYSGALDLTNYGFIQAGSYGVLMHGNAGDVTNTGHIISGSFGIMIDNFNQTDPDQSIFTIHNDGFISGTTSAIASAAADTTIELGSESELFSAGITINSSDTGTVDVENLGLIRSAAGTAFRGSLNNVDTFTNAGRIVGSIDLRGGSDIFTMRGGVIDGTVTGGLGDDTFIITKGNPTLRELAGEGDDTLRTAVTMALGADNEFETIILTGKKKLAFMSDASANDITGNRASNVIDGGFGSDTITGGKGHDTFVHGADGGLDTITDFTQGQDRLRIDIEGVDRFADLTITKQAQDVLIDMGDGDQFLIEHAKAGQFDKHDFLFG